MKVHDDMNLVISGEYLELRDKKGDFLRTIACRSCLSKVEIMLKRLKEKLKEKGL